MAGAKRRGILLRYFEEFRARQATAIGRGATGAESWVTLLGRRSAQRPQPALSRAGGRRAARARGRIAQRGGGGAVGAPMRRRERRPIEAPGSAAPNRSGDGAPASPHRRLGSRS